MAVPIRDNIPTDGMGDGAFLIDSFDPERTNVQGMLGAKATDWQAATVCGQITATKVFVPVNPAATDGSQNFAGINFSRRPANATAAQRGAITVRAATVNANLLYYDVAVTAPQKAVIEQQMAAQGVIVGY